MGLIKQRKVLDGVFWIEIPTIDLRMLCGCPADSIKHLALNGYLPTIEKEGTKIELGPNAILLSDVPIQNGSLANLSEFPLFHMFFTQGMIIPNHPNYGCPKPLLIGRSSQVEAQMEYVTIGNYGLTTEEQFHNVGETSEFAIRNINMKRRFALGEFYHTNELVQPIYLDADSVEVENGLTINRQSENIFEIGFKDESVVVDLNLPSKSSYGPSFELIGAAIPKSFFSITHTGEGDGWNPIKPSVSSVIQHKGKFYLVDSGPFITEILAAVGLSPNQIEGVFLTHVHDDHFGGLYDLTGQTNAEKKLKIYATNVVKATVTSKFSALLSISIQDVEDLFDFIELKRDSWNNINDLKVKPIPTAHPVDTTIILFKGKKGSREKVYGHYCDIAALSWLKSVMVTSEQEDGITREDLEQIRKIFNKKLDLKKIDVGGPSIHGDADDFINDPTSKLVLCHTHTPFTEKQLSIGQEVQFGQTDILIK